MITRNTEQHWFWLRVTPAESHISTGW